MHVYSYTRVAVITDRMIGIKVAKTVTVVLVIVTIATMLSVDMTSLHLETDAVP